MGGIISVQGNTGTTEPQRESRRLKRQALDILAGKRNKPPSLSTRKTKKRCK